MPYVSMKFGLLILLTTAVWPGQSADAACCVYSVGAAPRFTDWPVSRPDPMSPGSSTVFWASSADDDQLVTTCGSYSTTTYPSDGATVVWSCSDGTALSGSRGSSFSWQAPTLNPGECARQVTITFSADDTHTAHNDGGCDPAGERNDSPADTKTLVIIVANFNCSTTNGGALDGCREALETNEDGTLADCTGRKIAKTNPMPNPDGVCSVPDNIVQIAQQQVPNFNPNNPCGAAGTSFLNACVTHDNNYRSCTMTKAAADDQFRTDMLAACNGDVACPSVITLLGGFITYDSCHDYVTIYRAAMNTLDSQVAWAGSQQETCECCNPPEF